MSARPGEAGGELGVGPLRTAVGPLYRAEQRRLELVAGALVELLIGGPEQRKRQRDRLDRGAEVAEHLLTSLGHRVRHELKLRPQARNSRRLADTPPPPPPPPPPPRRRGGAGSGITVTLFFFFSPPPPPPPPPPRSRW